MGKELVLRIANLLMAGTLVGVAAAIAVYWCDGAMTGEGSMMLAALSVPVCFLLGLVALACVGLAIIGPERGRMLQTILALVLLFTFPVGTIYSLLALWVCWGSKGERPDFGHNQGRHRADVPWGAAVSWS